MLFDPSVFSVTVRSLSVLFAGLMTAGLILTGCDLFDPPSSDVFRNVEYRVAQVEESTAETPRPQRPRVWFVLANGQLEERVVRVPWSQSMRDSVGDSLAIAARGDYEKEGDEFEVAILVEGEVVARGEYDREQNVTVAQTDVPE